MTDRWTREGATPGEDPREIDAERTSDDALKETEAQLGRTHPQRRRSALGISSDAPGTDLDEAMPALDETQESLDPQEPEPGEAFGLGHRAKD